MKKIYYYQTEIGIIGIEEENGFLIEIIFGKESRENTVIEETVLIREAYRQIEEYLHHQRTEFHLPLQIEGTDFQRKTWEALLTIPYGETRSYVDIAEQIGNEKASRAVGLANHHNPLPIVVPCHRVIGKNGSLIGYAGGVELKEKLLRIERETACAVPRAQ